MENPVMIINYDALSSTQLAELVTQANEARLRRTERFKQMIASGDLQEIKRYFDQYPHHLDKSFTQQINNAFVDAIKTEDIALLEDLLKRPEYQQTPVKMDMNALSMSQYFALRALEDSKLLNYFLHSDESNIWKPEIKRLCQDGVWLNVVKSQDIISILDKAQCITWNKDFMEKVIYRTVFIKYALDNQKVTYSADEVLEIYLDKWHRLSGEVVNYFYHHFLQGKIEHLSFKQATSSGKHTDQIMLYQVQSVIRMDTNTVQFMFSHHKPEPVFIKMLLEEVQQEKKAQKVLDNFQAMCHVIFSVHPELSETIFQKLHELSALKQDGSLYHLAKKIQQYEKVKTLVDKNDNEISEPEDTSARKIKI
jgi:hypothetical protein